MVAEIIGYCTANARSEIIYKRNILLAAITRRSLEKKDNQASKHCKRDPIVDSVH